MNKTQVHPREFSLEGFPFYFSVAIYCFEGAGMILSLEESLASEVNMNYCRTSDPEVNINSS